MKYAVLSSLFLFLVLGNQAHGQTMSNGQYIIQEGGLNSFGGQATGPQHKLNFSNKETISGEVTNQTYTVSTGFSFSPGTSSTGGSTASDDAQAEPFSLSVSNSSIDFGRITPGEPIIRTTDLTVTTGDAPGFVVLTSENYSLRNTQGNEIPDTSCDAGNCTESIAGQWASPLTYGLGYRCDDIDGTSCLSVFDTLDFYRSFPNSNTGENTQSLMSARGVATNFTSQITYKLNIPGTQAPGVYQNTIQYIALPSI